VSKFFILFKKELRELITVATIIPMIIMFLIFFFLGDIIKGMSGGDMITVQAEQSAGDTGENEAAEITISAYSFIGFIDYDQSDLSEYIIDNLKYAGINPVIPEASDPEKAMNELEKYIYEGEDVKIQSLIVINKGFEEAVYSGKIFDDRVPVDVYSSIDSFGLTAVIARASAQSATDAINTLLSQKLFDVYGGDSTADININYIKFPVYSNDYTYLNGKTENVSASEILGYVSSQTMVLPIAIFFIIMMSTQMLAGSIVNEKADKTLETLMTTPLNRMSVLLAKIASSAIYAVIYAVTYIIAYQRFTNSLSGDASYSENFMEALVKFGISFDVAAFALIGAQLFLSVLCGLAISMLIGMMIEDIKTLQAYLMPLVFIIMIPYMLSMFVDLNTLPVIAQVILYAIPFTHTFTAATNLFVQNYTLLAIGIAYQAIFVAVLLTVAVKIFNSDKLFTLGQVLKIKQKNNSRSPLVKFFRR